jgi:hypothetical protein
MRKLQSTVTEKMLKEAGFRIVIDYELKAIRPNGDGSSTFIDKKNNVYAWDEEDIKDLTEKGWIECNP